MIRVFVAGVSGLSLRRGPLSRNQRMDFAVSAAVKIMGSYPMQQRATFTMAFTHHPTLRRLAWPMLASMATYLGRNQQRGLLELLAFTLEFN